MQSCQVFCSKLGFTYPQRKINCNPYKCLVSSSSFIYERPSELCYCLAAFVAIVVTILIIIAWSNILPLSKDKWKKANIIQDILWIHPWCLRVSQGFLVGKTNGRILRFLMQRSTIMCWEAFLVTLPSHWAGHLERGKVFLVYILCFSSLRFPQRIRLAY